jgi:hypothetical protein
MRLSWNAIAQFINPVVVLKTIGGLVQLLLSANNSYDLNNWIEVPKNIKVLTDFTVIDVFYSKVRKWAILCFNECTSPNHSI